MRCTLPLGTALLALVLVASGCGDRPAPPADAQGEWSGQRLAGPVGPDQSPRLATAGDDALVLLVSGHGRVQPHVSRDGAPFAAGTPFATGLDGFFDVLTPVRLADGTWYTVAAGGDDYVVRTLRSTDGLAWTVEPATGVTGRAEVTALIATADGVAAVGVRRHAADPSMGGFSALAWRSTDGRAFTEVALPEVPVYRGYRTESSVSGLVPVAGGALLATGRAGRAARVWRSADQGASWTAVDDPLLARADGVDQPVADGDRVLASVSGLSHPVVLSDDGGRSWRIDRGLQVPPESDDWVPLWQAGSRTLTVRSAAAEGADWSRPEACYADLDQCGAGAGPGPRLAVSEDGAHWRAVLGPTDVDAAAATADGRLLVLRSGAKGRFLDTWPAGVPLADAPGLDRPRTVDLVRLAEGERPAVGTRYAAPLYTHCGIDRIWFGEQSWQRTDDGPGYEAGDRPPAGWPIPPGGGSVYGYATLGADGVLTYADGGGAVLATYEKAAEPFFCA
ncbi:hypothetical protein ABFU82_03860 [Nocardioides sp. WV_118_6]